MLEMLTVVADVRSVCLSVCLSHGLNWQQRVQCALRAVCVGHSVQPSPNAFGLVICRSSLGC